MKITWEGKVWQYEDRNVTVQVASILKKETGLTWPTDFVDAVGKMDPRAVQALMWLVRSQNGCVETIDDVDGSLMDFLTAYAEAAQGDLDAADGDGVETDPPAAGVEAGASRTTSSPFVTVTS
jgi:hypothetical protein